MAKEDWQAINVRKELLNRLKELPDAKYLSQSGLVNRAVDEWLSSRGSLVSLSQFQESVSQWTDDDRMSGFLFLARYIAADLLSESLAKDGEFALLCWQKVTQGEIPNSPELMKLAAALDVDPGELKKKLTKLRELMTDGT